MKSSNKRKINLNIHRGFQVLDDDDDDDGKEEEEGLVEIGFFLWAS